MRIEKFTTKLQEALGDAQSAALGNDNQYIEPQHLLAALLDQSDGSIASILQRAGANTGALKTALAQAISRLPKVEGTPGEVMISRDLTQLLNVADKEAQKRGDQFIASELFLLAAADDKGETGKLLKQAGATKKALETAIEAVRGGQNVQSQADEGNREALKKYTMDLTERARIGKLDPVIGRDDEIRRCIQILQRRTKNNPVLIGEPGVGKTAIVEGPRPAHRQRGSARDAQGEARAVARHGLAPGRREVPRRIRGAPQDRPQGARAGRRPDHRLHRRDPHHGRRGQGRGRDGRGQHAQARARARRAALRRRDHARRIPQIHREGRGARAALPEGARGRALGGGHHRDPARPQGEIRSAPRRGDHRPGDRRRGRAFAPLHHRPVPARQGHRPHRRGGLAHQDGDRLQARVDGPARPAPDPAAHRARGGEEGKGRVLEEAPRPHRGGNQAHREGVFRPRRGVESREGAGRRLAAHQGRAREAAPDDGRGAPQGRLAEDVRDPVREDPAARGAAEEGRIERSASRRRRSCCAPRSARRKSPRWCRARPASRCRR